MFSVYYHRYKKWFWFILFFLFETGAISKYFHEPLWQVIFNAVLGLICLGIYLGIVSRERKKEASNK